MRQSSGERETFYTEDPAEASVLIGEVLAPNTLTFGILGAAGFSVGLHGARLRDVSLLRLAFGVATTVAFAACGEYFAVHRPTAGTTVFTSGGSTGEITRGGALVTSPAMPLSLRFEPGSPHDIVRIERTAMEHHLARLLGRTPPHPVHFELPMELGSTAAARWDAAVRLLRTEIGSPDSLARRGIGIGPLEEFLISSLLLVQPSDYHSQLVRPAELPGRRAVRRAVEYVETHLSQPVALADLAGYADMSVRSIQQGFREELDTTPMAYLRDRRLERAREELVDSLPSDGVSVADIALRWGFNHQGNFSILYRRRYGESPSETLRR
jgi:AraC-like DNA-binding protein